MKRKLLFFLTFFSFHFASSQPYFFNESEVNSCGPIPAVCTPGSINTGGLGAGITYFSLSQISNTSTNNSGGAGNQDFTCSDSTSLNQGDQYSIQITTGQTFAEVIRAWIDFNNDGNFDSTELIFADLPTVFIHMATITIQIAGQSGIPLRLRVGSEIDTYPPPDGCNDVQYGQYEDYTVYLNGPTEIEDFDFKNLISVYPNPFHNTATLKLRDEVSDRKNLVMKIYNTLGVLLREEKISDLKSYTLHRDGLSDGMYFYELHPDSYRDHDSQLIASGKFIVE